MSGRLRVLQYLLLRRERGLNQFADLLEAVPQWLRVLDDQLLEDPLQLPNNLLLSLQLEAAVLVLDAGQSLLDEGLAVQRVEPNRPVWVVVTSAISSYSLSRASRRYRSSGLVW